MTPIKDFDKVHQIERGSFGTDVDRALTKENTGVDTAERQDESCNMKEEQIAEISDGSFVRLQLSQESSE